MRIVNRNLQYIMILNIKIPIFQIVDSWLTVSKVDFFEST